MLKLTPMPFGVAPHAGAWIETMKVTVLTRRYLGRPSRRGVDWNI